MGREPRPAPDDLFTISSQVSFRLGSTYGDLLINLSHGQNQYHPLPRSSHTTFNKCRDSELKVGRQRLKTVYRRRRN